VTQSTGNIGTSLNGRRTAIFSCSTVRHYRSRTLPTHS